MVNSNFIALVVGSGNSMPKFPSKVHILSISKFPTKVQKLLIMLPVTSSETINTNMNRSLPFTHILHQQPPVGYKIKIHVSEV